MKMPFWAVLAFLLTETSLSFAENKSFQVTDSFELQRISQEPQWRYLLGYGSSVKSAVTNSEFFLSTSGSFDPYQELLATLNAFASEDSNIEKHAQCRFPGRYLWLSRRLDFNTFNIKVVSCSKFFEFSEQGKAQSLSLIFATGYLGNPASYYGHLLLKINAGQHSRTTSQESTAVNFGADVPEKENMLFYIIKGIFGGYDSSFTHQEYFYHSHNYGESELRDMWEYELDLDPADRELLIAHLWELMVADYTYYFFNRNCAYRMGDLLQLVVGNRVIESWRPWDTPQAVVQRLGNISYHGRPLVKKVSYHPSRQSRLYQRYEDLDTKERFTVHQLVKKKDDLEGKPLSSMALDGQFKVLDTMLDYYEFIREEKEGIKDQNNENYRKVLSKRYQLPPGDTAQQFASDNQPHLGRKPSYLNIGVISHETQGDSLSIWLRPAYYDSLDASYGHIKNASLSMAELTLGITEDDLYIREFNVVKIESLRRNFTGLPGDLKNSWYLEVGAKQEWLGCTDCLATKARTGYGYATSIFNDRLLMGGFIGGGFLGQSFDSENIYVSARAIFNVNMSEKLTFSAEAEQRRFQSDEDVHLYTVQARMELSKQTDARFYFAQDNQQELGLSVGFYW